MTVSIINSFKLENQCIDTTICDQEQQIRQNLNSEVDYAEYFPTYVFQGNQPSSKLIFYMTIYIMFFSLLTIDLLLGIKQYFLVALLISSLQLTKYGILSLMTIQAVMLASLMCSLIRYFSGPKERTSSAVTDKFIRNFFIYLIPGFLITLLVAKLGFFPPLTSSLHSKLFYLSESLIFSFYLTTSKSIWFSIVDNGPFVITQILGTNYKMFPKSDLAEVQVDGEKYLKVGKTLFHPFR